jgi:hypothetical protein
MNADKQDFEALRRLLKLKRHEKPPPRYFNDLSTQVVNRIRAGLPRDRANVMERLADESPWLQKVLSILLGKPIVTGALGAAACALLVGGAIYSERPPSGSTPVEFGGALPQLGVAQTASVFGNDSVLAVSSTNPVTSLNGAATGASIFDSITIKPVQQAGWRPGSN